MRHWKKFHLLVVITVVLASAAPSFAAISAEGIISDAAKALEGIQSLAVDLKITTFNDQKEMTVGATLQALLPNFVRLTYTQPDFLSGQVMLINRKTEEVSMYLPVTNQVIITPLSKLGGAAGMNLEFENIMALPDKEAFDFTLLGEETLNSVVHYVIHVKPKSDKGETQKIWLEKETLKISQIESFSSEGSLLARIELRNIEVNSPMPEDTLLHLPEDARVVKQ